MQTDATGRRPSPAIGYARIALGVVAGIVVGASANMGVIYAGMEVFPPPEGTDVNSLESINANIGRYSVAQLMVPFAAHAIGTLVGACVAALFAWSRRSRLVAAMVIGAFFLAGGASIVLQIPDSPLWFSAMDLLLAYFPMALLAWVLVHRLRGND